MKRLAWTVTLALENRDKQILLPCWPVNLYKTVRGAALTTEVESGNISLLPVQGLRRHVRLPYVHMHTPQS